MVKGSAIKSRFLLSTAILELSLFRSMLWRGHCTSISYEKVNKLEKICSKELSIWSSSSRI